MERLKKFWRWLKDVIFVLILIGAVLVVVIGVVWLDKLRVCV